MKFIRKIPAKDLSNLKSLKLNDRIKAKDALCAHYKQIRQNYSIYKRRRGNIKSSPIISPLVMIDDYKENLRQIYASPPKSLKPLIEEIRLNGSPNICPMCGAPKTGTIDHLFPKETYAEYSFFSFNLVPACDCNIKRKLALCGPSANERVLHPYFDEILCMRLIVCTLTPTVEFGYKRPLIDFKIAIPESHQSYPAVKFHLDNIIRKTSALASISTTWISMLRHPSDHLILPATDISLATIKIAMKEATGVQDRFFGTPNNWRSMLLSGLEIDDNALIFLVSIIDNIRNGRLDPQLI